VSKKAKVESAEKQPPDFEKSLAELEKIVARMEAGELSLDESLQQFERGVALARACQQALQSAEQKVEMLLKKSGVKDGLEAVPFATDDEDIDE
jgi:exodeoxyribonuclease VII small subunit